MLPSLEPSPLRGLKTNSMVEFHMHLLDSSNTVFPALSLFSVMLKSPALSLLVCKGLVLHQFTFRHFSTLFFFSKDVKISVITTLPHNLGLSY